MVVFPLFGAAGGGCGDLFPYGVKLTAKVAVLLGGLEELRQFLGEVEEFLVRCTDI